jgi:ATP-binding protein involved in chromosome partitioning
VAVNLAMSLTRAGHRTGLLENMIFLPARTAGTRRTSSAMAVHAWEAQRQGTELLGEVSLLLDIRLASDAGTPIAAAAPESDGAKAFAAVAARVWAKVSGGRGGAASGPRIVVE